jgi:hypothetical protein
MEQPKVNIPALNNNGRSFRTICQCIINLLRCNCLRSPTQQGTPIELRNVVEPRPIDTQTSNKLPEENIKKVSQRELVDKIFSDIHMDDKTFRHYLTLRNTHL